MAIAAVKTNKDFEARLEHFQKDDQFIADVNLSMAVRAAKPTLILVGDYTDIHILAARYARPIRSRNLSHHLLTCARAKVWCQRISLPLRGRRRACRE